MNPEFAVGEVAIYIGPRAPYYGSEVTIEGPLTYALSRTAPPEPPAYRWLYCVSAPWLGDPDRGAKHWGAEPRWLRKRPPKQDWSELCRLSDQPVSEPA